jgi:hypothetical protein
MCDTNRIIKICVASTKVAKESKLLDIYGQVLSLSRTFLPIFLPMKTPLYNETYTGLLSKTSCLAAALGVNPFVTMISKN